MFNKKSQKSSGFITLMIMLIVSAVVFLLIISALRSSVNSSQGSLAILQSAKARAYANSCIEEALYAIHLDPSNVSATGNKSIDTGNCSYTITPPESLNTQNSTVWTILSTGVENDVTVQISTNALLNNSDLSIIDWNEDTHGNSFTLNYASGPHGSVDVTTEQVVNYSESGPTVTATPDTNYHFVSWSDGRTDNPRTDTNVSRNISVTANFASDTFTLTYVAGNHGSITGNTIQIINYNGSGTTVTAVPDTDYIFQNWSDGSTSNPRTDLNVNDNISVTANFSLNTRTLTYSAGANGFITGPTSQTVDSGSDGATVTAVPNTNYHFINWSDGSTANPRTDTNVINNISVNANFSIDQYSVVYESGAHGSITGNINQTVNYGGSGTAVTAVPDTGYHFVNWSDSSTSNPHTDTNVTQNISLTANFLINTYTLTYTAGAHGSITGTTTQTANYGTDGTAVTAVPDTGYHFVNWSDNSTSNPRTDTSVVGNISVTANFTQANWTIDGLDYTHRKKITISNTNVAADLTDFPLLVSIVSDSDIGGAALSTGNDLRFTASNGTTLLPVEKENFSIAGGVATGNFWVKVPTISHSTNTDIYVYYGNAGAGAQSTPTGVWDTNFKGVWHLAQSGGPFSDSTITGNNTTGGTYPTQTDAKIGKGQSYNGSTQYAQVTTNGIGKFNTPSYTISMWVKTPTTWGTTSSYRFLWSYDKTSHASPYYAQQLRFTSGGATAGDLILGWNDGTNFHLIGQKAAISTNSWHYITAVFTSGRQELWDNGTIYDSGTYADTITYYAQYVWWNRANPSIGKDYLEDEIRFSSVARPAEWIKFEYHNQGDSGNNLTFGSAETP